MTPAESCGRGGCGAAELAAAAGRWGRQHAIAALRPIARNDAGFQGLLGFLWVLDAAVFLVDLVLLFADGASRDVHRVGRAVAGQTPVCPLACPTGSQRLPGQGRPKAVA
jgi:hypothetical protein